MKTFCNEINRKINERKKSGASSDNIVVDSGVRDK
jgi:hypothetical protein